MVSRLRLSRPYVLCSYDWEFSSPTTPKAYPKRRASPLSEVDSTEYPTSSASLSIEPEPTEYSSSGGSPLSQADWTEYHPPREISTRVFRSYVSHSFRPQKPINYPSRGEFDEVKAIIAPYWHIFNLVLEYEPRLCVDHSITPSPGPGKPMIVCESVCLPVNGRLIQAYGSGVHAFWTSPTLQSGSNKFNHCDLSIRLFLYILEPLLSRVGATITWLAVEMKPYWVIHWKSHRPNPQVRHSVFSITTQSGDEYIADFTVEQFGFSGKCWLMCRREYEELCTTGKKRRQPRAEEVEEARRGDINDWNEKASVVRMVCGIIHDYPLESMDTRTMIRQLEVLVKDACWQIWYDQPAYQWFQ